MLASRSLRRCACSVLASRQTTRPLVMRCTNVPSVYGPAHTVRLAVLCASAAAFASSSRCARGINIKLKISQQARATARELARNIIRPRSMRKRLHRKALRTDDLSLLRWNEVVDNERSEIENHFRSSRAPEQT